MPRATNTGRSTGMLTIASLRTDPDPILRAGTDAVLLEGPGDIRTALETTAEQMLVVMALLNGVGLAAPQVGLGSRLFVLAAQERTAVVCNPEIIERHDPYHPVEGCLSVPGMLYTPRRHRRIRARWSTLDGRHHDETLTGLLAEIFEHEVDHLDGRLLYDLPQGAAEPR